MFNNNDNKKSRDEFHIGRGVGRPRTTTTTTTTTTTKLTGGSGYSGVGYGGVGVGGSGSGSGINISNSNNNSGSGGVYSGVGGIKKSTTGPIKYNSNNAPKQFEPRKPIYKKTNNNINNINNTNVLLNNINTINNNNINTINSINNLNNNIINSNINNTINTINNINQNISTLNQSLIKPKTYSPPPNITNSSPFKSTISNSSISDYQSDYIDEDDAIAILEAALSSPSKSPTKESLLDPISPIKNTTTTTTTTTTSNNNNNNSNNNTYKNPFSTPKPTNTTTLSPNPTTTTTTTTNNNNNNNNTYINPFSSALTNAPLAARTPDFISPIPSPKVEPIKTTMAAPALDETDTASHELILQLLQQDIQDLGLDLDVRKDPYLYEYYAEQDDEDDYYDDQNNDMSYEALSQLEPVRVGITEEQKKYIKEYKFNQYKLRAQHHHDVEEDAKRCCICLEDYQEISLIKELRCKHFFHSDCIETWLDCHNKCPACREEV